MGATNMFSKKHRKTLLKTYGDALAIRRYEKNQINYQPR